MGGWLNKYESPETAEKVAQGEHRQVIGGRWKEIGRLQFKFLVEQGLAPDSYMLDVGCGALRGGVRFARYLEPGHYFGIDSNQTIVDAALEKEVPKAGLEDRVTADSIRVTSRFECDFGVPFDFALALSVFTHLPLNHFQLCMSQLAQVMAPGGRFFVTFFEPEPGGAFDTPAQQVEVRTYPEKDPFHYRPEHLEWAARSVADWQFRYIGDWGHPRGQKMGEFRLRGRSAGTLSRLVAGSTSRWRRSSRARSPR